MNNYSCFITYCLGGEISRNGIISKGPSKHYLKLNQLSILPLNNKLDFMALKELRFQNHEKLKNLNTTPSTRNIYFVWVQSPLQKFLAMVF